MTLTSMALLGYISWTMILLLVLAGYRTQLSKVDNRGLKFNPDGSDVPQLGLRITRAQANCVESFPFVGGVMLAAMAMGLTNITDGLALVVLGARLGQSITHLISIAGAAIQVRFVFFLVQLAICFYWIIAMFLQG